MLMMLSRSLGGPSLHLSTLAVLGVLILGYGCSEASISGDLVTDTSVIDAVFEVVGGTDSAEIRVEPPPEQTPCDARPDLCDIAISGVSAVSEPIFVVPSDGLPKEVSVDVANNNLDVIWWKGRFWLAWRTGPYHFAAETVKMYVASSSDLRDWRLEGEVSLGTDVREPQLVILNDQLLFYYAELGKNALAFEPQGTWLLRYKSPGEWTEPVSVFESSFIPWRIRTVGDRLQVFGYTGGENIYEADGEPIDVHWLESSDGLNWYPVVQDQAVVLTGGSSETDAVVLADGTLIGVSRNEAGDSNGFGMKICRAESNALGDWTCVADKKKYDSPLVFEYAGRVFLIGRRNVTETGHYDLDQTELSFEQQSTVNQLDYSGQPKRCSLWTIDTTSLNVSFVLDLPSAGDTCFPEIIELGSGRFIVFNYTSLLGQTEDPSWSTGQFEPTHIYHSVITVPAANASSP